MRIFVQFERAESATKAAVDLQVRGWRGWRAAGAKSVEPALLRVFALLVAMCCVRVLACVARGQAPA